MWARLGLSWTALLCRVPGIAAAIRGVTKAECLRVCQYVHHTGCQPQSSLHLCGLASSCGLPRRLLIQCFPGGKNKAYGIFRVVGLERHVTFSAFQCQAMWQGQPTFRRWTQRFQSHSTKEHVHMVPRAACFWQLANLTLMGMSNDLLPSVMFARYF